jgi:hypothetical protein
MAFFGFAGKTVSAEETAKITGLNQTGVLVGLLHEIEARSLVFVPDRLADGSRNNAFTTLMSHAPILGRRGQDPTRLMPPLQAATRPKNC